MTAFPESFVILDAFAEIPPIAHRGRRLFACWSSFNLAALDPGPLSESLEREEAGGILRFRLPGSQSPMMSADFYWDTQGHEALIYAKHGRTMSALFSPSRGTRRRPWSRRWT